MKKLFEIDDQNMYSLYFLFTGQFNEKLKRNYIWQNLHKQEGERNMNEKIMHLPNIFEGDEKLEELDRKDQIAKLIRGKV